MFLMNNTTTKRISPKWINALQKDEIFVFGSNADGFHGGGAAHQAMKWGAVWGQGTGLQGKDFTESGVGCIHYGQIYTYYGTFTDTTKSFVSEEAAKKFKKAQKAT
jgi:hypothetical protein